MVPAVLYTMSLSHVSSIANVNAFDSIPDVSGARKHRQRNTLCYANIDSKQALTQMIQFDTKAKRMLVSNLCVQFPKVVIRQNVYIHRHTDMRNRKYTRTHNMIGVITCCAHLQYIIYTIRTMCAP